MTPRSWIVVTVLSVLLGVFGWIAMAVVADLWTDHQRLHAIWELELRRAQASQAQGAAGGS